MILCLTLRFINVSNLNFNINNAYYRIKQLKLFHIIFVSMFCGCSVTYILLLCHLRDNNRMSRGIIWHKTGATHYHDQFQTKVVLSKGWLGAFPKKKTTSPLFLKKKSKISGGGIFVLSVPNTGNHPWLSPIVRYNLLNSLARDCYQPSTKV